MKVSSANLNLAHIYSQTYNSTRSYHSHVFPHISNKIWKVELNFEVDDLHFEVFFTAFHSRRRIVVVVAVDVFILLRKIFKSIVIVVNLKKESELFSENGQFLSKNCQFK